MTHYTRDSVLILPDFLKMFQQAISQNGIDIQMTVTENESRILIGRWMKFILTPFKQNRYADDHNHISWPSAILFHYKSISILIVLYL